jgi:hypothetical protein
MGDRVSALRGSARTERWRWLGPPLVLLILGVGTRVPFRSSILQHWDSVNFALALEHFDIRSHQPHPPGTSLIYILAGRLLQSVFRDANTSLVSLSILASGLAAAFTFIVAATWFGRRVGWTAALLLLTSPLVWFHGEVALTYAPELTCVLAVVWACMRTHDGSRGALFASAVLMGLAGGVRLSTPVFLLPLWLFTVAGSLRERRCSGRHVVGAALLMTGAFAAWFIPLLAISGGPAAYWDIIREWSAAQWDGNSIGSEMALRAVRFAVYNLWGLSVAVVPVMWMLAGGSWRWNAVRRDRRLHMLALWIIPSAVYLLTVHLRQPGHTFTFMPALLIIGGLATAQWAERWPTKRRAEIVTALVLTGNVALFLLAPATLFGSHRLLLRTPSWTTIRSYDVYVSERLAAIRTHFSPEDTAVIAGSYNFRIPDFYLRDYQCLSLSRAADDRLQTLPAHVRQLVIFDDSVLPQVGNEPGVQSLVLPSGGRIRVVKWTAAQQVQVSQTTLRISRR